MPTRLRWEISAALLVKIILLVGLWFLIFRWSDRPTTKPDVAQHLLTNNPVSIQSTQEFNHVR
ncbi:MAG: cytochrome oxidase putative small subunit CydP [Methylomonas sp.]